MKKATLKALKQSIAHWERLRDGKQQVNENCEGNSCALCKRFASSIVPCTLGTKKEKCPVYKKTGLPHCLKTPYRVARVAFYYSGFELFEAADKEVKFLKSLVPFGLQ